MFKVVKQPKKKANDLEAYHGKHLLRAYYFSIGKLTHPRAEGTDG